MFVFASSRGRRGGLSVASFQDDSCGEFNFAKLPSGTEAEGLCQGPVAFFTGCLRWTCVMRHGNRRRMVVIGGDINGSDRTGERPCDRDDRCFLHMRLLLLGEARTSPDRHDTYDVIAHGSFHPEIRLRSYFNSGIFYRAVTRHLCLFCFCFCLVLVFGLGFTLFSCFPYFTNVLKVVPTRMVCLCVKAEKKSADT